MSTEVIAVTDAYAIQARLYDLVVEPLNGPLRAAAHRLCPPHPGWTVLDVGCGTGSALAEYAAAGCHVIGADPSPAMIAQARDRLGSAADLRLIDGSRLPVDDASADLVLVSLVLHSVRRDEAVGILREAARVLVADGRVLVVDFGTSGLRFPRGWLGRGITVLAELAAGPRHAANSFDYLRRGGLPALVDEAGLEAQAVRPTAGGAITIAVLAPTRSPRTGRERSAGPEWPPTTDPRRTPRLGSDASGHHAMFLWLSKPREVLPGGLPCGAGRRPKMTRALQRLLDSPEGFTA